MRSLEDGNLLLSREEIEKRVKELGKEISKSYEGEELLVISLLKGSFIFAADLVREIDVPVEVDFITTASYGHSEVSSGSVDIIHEPRSEIEGRNILIVDDIVDSGRTLKKVQDILLEKKPNSVKICTMLDKPSRRTEELEVEWVGFEIDDLFVVGYGLNYEAYYRNIPYIFTFDD